MKAAVLERTGSIEVRDVPKPQVSGREVLLKTVLCGVCTTDIKIATGKKKASSIALPRILGHEIVGRVTEVGNDHDEFSPGDLVVPYPGISCGRCEYCRGNRHRLCRSMGGLGYNVDGGFAEYVRLPGELLDNTRSRVLRVPDSLPLIVASLLEPVSCCWNGVKQSRVAPGSSVLVVGLGFIGLVIMQLARVFGASEVIGLDPIQTRRERAEGLGADAVFDPTARGYGSDLMGLTHGEGVDAVIVALGDPRVFEAVLGFAKRGGTVNLFGGAPHDSTISLNPDLLHYEEIELLGSHGYRLQDAGIVMGLLRSGRINVESLVDGAIYPLEEISTALNDAAEHRVLKAIVDLA